MTLVYAYGILRATDARPEAVARIAGIPGIAGDPLRLVTEGPCAAAVSDVPEGDFAETPLNEHLGDLDWLGPRAVLHQEANAALRLVVSSLVPLSFGTVFHDDAGVARLLAAERDTLVSRLNDLAGREEWIAMLRRDDAVATAALDAGSAPLRALREEIRNAAAGRAYLLGRRLGDTVSVELRQQDAEADARVGELLAAAGARLYREPVVENAGAGPEVVVARYSALVLTAAAGSLAAAASGFAAEWAARGYALELSGPWPAYRFAALEASAS
ncbi:MAG: GvpL/GvpF family gas vesicle protein [Candidatus Limnocylindrales bacterium]